MITFLQGKETVERHAVDFAKACCCRDEMEKMV